MLLPLIWAGLGLVEVLVLQYIFNGLSGVIPSVVNDKPIGGSLLPLLFISTAMVLAVVSLSLYSIGYWEPNLSSRKGRTDLLVLAILVVSGFFVFYTPFAVFPLVLAGFYFLAVNLD